MGDMRACYGMEMFENMGLQPFKELGTTKECAVKLLEEAAEAMEAAKTLISAEQFIALAACRKLMLDEFADVLQAFVNLCAVTGVTEDELINAIGRCNERNRERGRL